MAPTPTVSGTAYQKIEDFTWYEPTLEALRKLVDQDPMRGGGADGASESAKKHDSAVYSGKLRVQDAHGWVEGRALACSCWGGTWTSVTLRREDDDKTTSVYPNRNDWLRDDCWRLREETLQPSGLIEQLQEYYRDVPSRQILGGSNRRLKQFRKVLKMDAGVDTPTPEVITRLLELLIEVQEEDLIQEKRLRQWAAHLGGLTRGLLSAPRSPAFRRFLLSDLFPGLVPLPVRFGDRCTSSSEKPIPFRHVFNEVADQIFGPPTAPFVPRQGLIVVSGSTSAGKSNIVRGVILNYLARYTCNRPKSRRPHLLTLEDPIEKFFAADPLVAQQFGVDYTPRQIGLDTPSLNAGLSDALRQSPAVLYVGEVRDQRDWRQLINFAGTGHLVVTSTHAGTLVEAMGRILEAARANTPAERGYVAQRLSAVVHLQSFSIKDQTVVIPALWRQTPVGIARLVADGLASILPNAAGDYESSVGRRWFAEQLIRAATSLPYSQLSIQAEMRQQALTWDLEGV